MTNLTELDNGELEWVIGSNLDKSTSLAEVLYAALDNEGYEIEPKELTPTLLALLEMLKETKASREMVERRRLDTRKIQLEKVNG